MASGLWFYSTQVRVEPVPDAPDGSGDWRMVDSDDKGQLLDVLATAKRQVSWNRWAAIAASVAAFAQAAVIIAAMFVQKS